MRPLDAPSQHGHACLAAASQLQVVLLRWLALPGGCGMRWPSVPSPARVPAARERSQPTPRLHAADSRSNVLSGRNQQALHQQALAALRRPVSDPRESLACSHDIASRTHREPPRQRTPSCASTRARFSCAVGAQLHRGHTSNTCAHSRDPCDLFTGSSSPQS